ncbi:MULTISPECIES: hypothetical protein [unclassified Micromonospora]|uniref:hypothetical protein n=1 Tax=unclassified Micromonospora TaxID=2617518 RepID=UPI00331DB488
MRTASMRRTALALAVAAVLLTGCGEGAGDGVDVAVWATPADNGVAGLTPEQILEKSLAATKAAKSFRIKGFAEADGTPIRLDFKFSGRDVHGTVTMEGATVEMLSVGGDRYIRPDKKFWALTAGANAADRIAILLGDRWAIVPDDDKSLRGLFTLVDVDKLFEPEGTLTKNETTEVAGTPAVGLVDQGGDSGTLWVARFGEPYPVRMDAPPDEEGQVTFTEFGAPFAEIRKPAAADVVDLEKLAGR